MWQFEETCRATCPHTQHTLTDLQRSNIQLVADDKKIGVTERRTGQEKWLQGKRCLDKMTDRWMRQCVNRKEELTHAYEQTKQNTHTHNLKEFLQSFLHYDCYLAGADNIAMMKAHGAVHSITPPHCMCQGSHTANKYSIRWWFTVTVDQYLVGVLCSKINFTKPSKLLFCQNYIVCVFFLVNDTTNPALIYIHFHCTVYTFIWLLCTLIHTGSPIALVFHYVYTAL